jgi:hypothetical protein
MTTQDQEWTNNEIVENDDEGQSVENPQTEVEKDELYLQDLLNEMTNIYWNYKFDQISTEEHGLFWDKYSKFQQYFEDFPQWSKDDLEEPSNRPAEETHKVVPKVPRYLNNKGNLKDKFAFVMYTIDPLLVVDQAETITRLRKNFSKFKNGLKVVKAVASLLLIEVVKGKYSVCTPHLYGLVRFDDTEGQKLTHTRSRPVYFSVGLKNYQGKNRHPKRGCRNGVLQCERLKQCKTTQDVYNVINYLNKDRQAESRVAEEMEGGMEKLLEGLPQGIAVLPDWDPDMDREMKVITE